MKFLNNEHKVRFESLVAKSKVSLSDQERLSALFVLSGNTDLFGKVNDLYDFKKNQFKVEFEENEETGECVIKWRPLSSSERALVTLAFDLYAGQSNISVFDTFKNLGYDNRALAIEAIRYRFS